MDTSRLGRAAKITGCVRRDRRLAKSTSKGAQADFQHGAQMRKMQPGMNHLWCTRCCLPALFNRGATPPAPSGCFRSAAGAERVSRGMRLNALEPRCLGIEPLAQRKAS
jgi:hypothetical protein